MHGVFSRAWTGTCVSCKTRRKDDRKLPVMPADWIFPLRRCKIEDVFAWCPHETERVLTYMYGESFLTPPSSTRPAVRLTFYAAVVLGAYRAWAAFRIAT